MYCKDSPETIQTLFNSIAKRYDIANAILSLSLHKRWNRNLVRYVRQTHPSHRLLDLCSGTGDIAFDYLRTTSHSCQAYLIDFSSEMLEYARQKANRLGLSSSHPLSFIQADVQHLPLPPQFADCASMAYGMRNVRDPELCIKEVFRVLKPGGCFGILELTRPRSALLRFGHAIYLRTILPTLGKWLTDNKQAYHYLCQSIQNFIAPSALEELLIKNGFIQTHRHSLAGGIATIIVGYKPHA